MGGAWGGGRGRGGVREGFVVDFHSAPQNEVYELPLDAFAHFLLEFGM